MKVEREIAGISITFATGTFIAAYACACLGSSCHHAATAFLLATSLLLIYMMAMACKLQKGSAAQTGASLLMILCCGAFCGFSAQITSFAASGPGWIESQALMSGRAMQSAIDRIPFNDSTTSALIKALLTGEKADIPSETVSAFRESGAAHILALSGMHLGIIYMMINRALSILGNTAGAKKARSCITVCLCGFYTMATGSGASIVRAFLFILLGECAAITGRRHNIRITIMSAMLIQLTISPLSIKNIGFQLSYAAMAGIAYLHPLLKDLWPLRSKLWESATLSIACQITTGPLAYIYFGTFPKYFLLTNLIALPITGLLIPAAAATLVLSAAGICPETLIRATEKIALTLIWSLGIISEM